jgi:hypothetical protein
MQGFLNARQGRPKGEQGTTEPAGEKTTKRNRSTRPMNHKPNIHPPRRRSQTASSAPPHQPRLQGKIKVFAADSMRADSMQGDSLHASLACRAEAMHTGQRWGGQPQLEPRDSGEAHAGSSRLALVVGGHLGKGSDWPGSRFEATLEHISKGNHRKEARLRCFNAGSIAGGPWWVRGQRLRQAWGTQKKKKDVEGLKGQSIRSMPLWSQRHHAAVWQGRRRQRSQYICIF